jgi:putative peptide zinc metalloprotease protein
MLPASTPRPISQRPLPFSARKDLSAHRVQYGDQWYWVLKDPLRNELFRLRGDQYAVHQLLDGRRSLDDIRERIAAEFRELTVTAAQVQELVIDLFRKGLVWSTRSGQAAPLARRQCEHRRRRWLAAVQNPLFIRLPGWDPQRFLDRCLPAAERLFHPAALLAGGALIVAAWCFLLTRFDEFMQRAPSWAELVGGQSLLVFWFLLAGIKTLHELGHALACRRLGGECHEIGVALMMFSPSMYCDVSDAGRLASRWARIGVGAAGMYVELVLSSLALFGWWLTREGLLHQACWSVFVIGNVGIVAFNLNPLLRLDGYYMLSDWLGIPNLRQKANRAAGRVLCRAALGVTLPEEPGLSPWRRRLLAGYAVASTVFQLQIVVIIAVVLYHALAPYGLQQAGLWLGIVAATTSIARGGGTAVRGWRRHVGRAPHAWRPRATVVLIAAVVAAALFIPFPTIATAPLVVEPVDAQPVYVTVAGQLTRIHVRPGQSVKRGDVLVQLANRELAEHQRVVTASYEMQGVAVAVHRALGDAGQEAIAAEIHESLGAEVQSQSESIARLTVRAPCDGTVIVPPKRRNAAALGTNHESGSTPLAASELGAFLPIGTHVLTVAPRSEFQPVLLVDQKSQHCFAPGREVRIKLDHAPRGVLRGVIETRSVLYEQSAVAGERSDDGFGGDKMATDSLGASVARAVVRLDAADAPLVAGLRGEARVMAVHPSFAVWAWRHAKRTFNFL